MNWDFLIKDQSSLTVTTDSRRVTPGCIFVAIKGEHFDGNDFVEQAQKDGAAYIIRGENALSELQDLARAWRRELALPILGITGTNGKTTTKELMAAVLSQRYQLHYTQGNYNNSLGVPLTLLQITRQHQMAIVEMGASHPGDIRELVEVAEPNFGLITNVGRAHLQGFGSFEGVKQTKAELYDYLIAHNGTVFINEDNPDLQQMWSHALSSSPSPSPYLPPHKGGLRWVSLPCPMRERVGVRVYHTSPMPTGTHLVGSYNAENIAAALSIGEYFGIRREEALAAIRAYVPTNNRSQAVQTEHNQLVVDAYNANPTSMAASINAFLHEQTSNELTFILGEMRELGEYSHLEHQNIVNMLLEHKMTDVYLVGQEYKQTTAPYPIFDDVTALVDYLTAHPLHNKRILIKGSRGNQLEKILPLL
ncbi:MAG: UDP-N-acetylmuramoyl-tripeptide--D-alanyl-D-alanine ligase [Bacteroidales bacterium]|nr:UDP-N-acetylmuramoyl-tripeptide--D-alanyl-D-alanine ligase [Candidatus Colicola coprequi]